MPGVARLEIRSAHDIVNALGAPGASAVRAVLWPAFHGWLIADAGHDQAQLLGDREVMGVR